MQPYRSRTSLSLNDWWIEQPCKAIFWGTVLLTFSILVAAILAVQFIDPPWAHQVRSENIYSALENIDFF